MVTDVCLVYVLLPKQEIISFSLRVGLDLKAQTMEMAHENECNNAFESLRKAEMKKLSVLAVFSDDTDDSSVLYDKYWESLQLTGSLFIHASVIGQVSLHGFFDVGQEFSKSRGNSWKCILSKMSWKYLIYCPWGNYFGLEK